MKSYFDTMIAAYLLDPTSRRFRLSDLSLKFFDYKMTEYEELTPKGKNKISLALLGIKEATAYSSQEAEITYALVDILEKKLQEEELLDLFYNIEMPLTFVLQDMEKTGIKIDVSYLKHLSTELSKEIEILEKKIIELAGESFNINSPKQLQTILFEKLKLPMKRKTKTGSSTDISVLEQLSTEHELPLKILEYRQFQKLKSTYIDALPQIMNKETGRVHTSFNQTITATGRLSSSNPNLQNIPIRSEWGKKIREAFIVEEGNVLLAADYSQIELRLFAHIAADENMIEGFSKGEDIHGSTASHIFNIPFKSVTSDQRRYAKTINFGLMYGMGAFRLSKELGISLHEAKEFIDNYFKAYPKIQQCIEHIVEDATEKGYVKTLFGRKRYVPELNNMNRTVQEQGKREAVNAVFQGTAADIIKIAMIRIHKKLVAQKMSSKMILQVHDELLFEVPEEELDVMKKLVQEEMEGVMALQTHLKVDIGVGKNWLEAH